jgi:Helix-turn-helix of DDE superfamily endonuclease
LLTYPATIDLSEASLRFLARRLREHRRAIGCRWRKLTAARQALLALAHLRNSDTYIRLACGFRIGVAIVYWYIREAIDLLAALAPTLADAVRTARSKAYVIATARSSSSTEWPPTGPTTQVSTNGAG